VRGPPGDLPAEGKPFPFPCRKHQAEPRINPFCAASFSVINGNRSYRCALRRPRIVVAHVCSSPKSPAPTPVPYPQEVGATFLRLRAVRQCAVSTQSSKCSSTSTPGGSKNWRPPFSQSRSEPLQFHLSKNPNYPSNFHPLNRPNRRGLLNRRNPILVARSIWIAAKSKDSRNGRLRQL
jgi:hypothetical protein